MPSQGDDELPSVILVMGVSGSGKTTIGKGLADRLGWEFQDADGFHPAANVEKMRAGIPLTDEDRWPWLHAIAAWIDETRRAGRHGVVTCSALKRAYREILVGDRDDVCLVHLAGEREVIARRMAARHGHFMPPTLLDSQFAALEAPGRDERPVVAAIEATPEAIVADILEQIGKQWSKSA